MTERLYYNDCYLREFRGRVIDTADDGRKIYLDRTAFYPTSGGQPFDTGYLGGLAVIDVIDESLERVRAAAPAHIDDARAHAQPLIGMSAAMQSEHLELKQFLREQLYRHQRVLRMTTKAKRVVTELFAAFMREIKLLPAEYRDGAMRLEARDGIDGRARTVADYIAGMTDRYAILEHRRLFDPNERT